MLDRRTVVAAVAAMSLGLGSTCLFVRADDTAQDKQTQDKNPAAIQDKNKTADLASDIEMQKKEDMEEKMKSDLMSNFNDADFVKVASMSNEDEIKAAQDAEAKSSNEDVKKFAQQMIDDHTKAGTELKTLADSKGWTISDNPDVKHMRAMEAMDKMNGTDFDKSYASTAVADHQDAVALFNNTALLRLNAGINRRY